MNKNGREVWIRAAIRSFAGLAMAVLAGCTALQFNEPDWVRNPKTVYPESHYLVAVGEGDTRRAAENAADANLARIFEARIESDERMVDRISESTDDFVRTTDLTTDINILSSQTLINIQHAEAWRDDQGRYHAVAYLDRKDTAPIYRNMMEELTEEVLERLGHADTQERLLGKYANYRAALHTARANALLLQQLKVIHAPSASAAAPPYSINEIQRLTVESAKRVRVTIQIEGDHEGRMTACIQELITRYGFVVGAPPVIHIKGQASVTDTGQRTDGLSFYRYNLSVQITDTSGNVLAAINELGREAVTSPNEALSRCYRTMENAVKSKGSQRLDEFFDSLTMHAP
jgi:hypothetical protein